MKKCNYPLIEDYQKCVAITGFEIQIKVLRRDWESREQNTQLFFNDY